MTAAPCSARACWARSAVAASLVLASTLAASAAGPGGSVAAGTARAEDTCRVLAETPWPITPAARAQLLGRLEERRERCIDNAPYLALLGALWLEQGDPGQALLWLERSLMLDATVPVVLADHALALAALGDRTAVAELLQRWQDRPDVPTALRARLEQARQGAAPRLPPRASVGTPGAFGITWRRSLSLLRGHETNLDHSPRLSEITLSSPDGPIDLPLVNPIVPRRGSAWVAEGTLHSLFIASAGVLWEAGIHAAARHSEKEPSTDTRQVQLALMRWQQHDGWRSQLQLAAQRVTGPLSEPFSTYTLGLAGERDWNGCGSRGGLDTEWRRQDTSRIVDSLTVALQGGLNCRIPGLAGWGGGVALRLGWDRPRDAARPGGLQQQSSLGLRTAGPLGAGFRVELSARATRLVDRLGYSPLLESNARRQQKQQQLSLELTRGVPAIGSRTIDLVLQVQQLRQSSNLQLFNQNGRAAFLGMRADW